jgi:hypothetical protein
MTADAAARTAATVMQECALALLSSLEEPQREKASFRLDNTAERTDWAYFPRPHKGVPLLEMTPKQQKATHALIAAALSLPAYTRVCSIMALESVLNLLEERRVDAARDPGRYFVSIFGTPSDTAWGWRLEGHHVNLNYTVVSGEVVAVTPLFLGANPAEVARGDKAVLRPCAEEEDAARSFLESLDPAQRSNAIICEEAPPDFVLMNAPLVPDTALPPDSLGALNPRQNPLTDEEKEAVRFDRSAPKGLAAGALTLAQRAAFLDLIGIYVDRLPEALADAERARIEAAGIDGVHFAWAGSQKRREGHYYRIQGPSFLVEYDNTQDGANHVHAVWRDAVRDFGLDTLREHTAASHGGS